MKAAVGGAPWCVPGNHDARALRGAFGAYGTGVAVIGVRGSTGALAGMTVNSFVSVSLNPPLVSFSPSRRLSALNAYLDATHFAVSVLCADNQAQSSHFARPGSGKWQGMAYALAPSGAPVLADALAAFDCRQVQRVEAGDHIVLIGEVRHYLRRAGADPLLFWAGGYRRLAADASPTASGEANGYLLGWGG